MLLTLHKQKEQLTQCKIHSAASDPNACYTAVPGCLCSLEMCLLKWTQVIEWDNLKTHGLGLLLATIFSEGGVSVTVC